MIRPVRLQLSRRKGFNLQTLSRKFNGLDAVKVSRPGRWGNLACWCSHNQPCHADVFLELANSLETE